MLVTQLLKGGKSGAGMVSETIQKYSYIISTKDGDDLLAPVKPFLARYREFRLGGSGSLN